MTRLAVTPNVLDVLSLVSETTEIIDEAGVVIGVFVPTFAEKHSEEDVMLARKLFDLDRARETLRRERGQGRPLSEIWDRIRAEAGQTSDVPQ